MNIIAVMFTFSFSSAFATVEKGAVAEDTAQIAIAADFMPYAGYAGLTTANSSYGKVGVTTEGKAAMIDVIDDNLDDLDDAVYWSGNDYKHYYGARLVKDEPVAVEAKTTSYVGKALKQYRKLTEAAKEVARRTSESNLAGFVGAVGDLVSGFVWNKSGIPNVLWEDSTATGEKATYLDDFMSNAEYKELVAIWTEAKEKAEKSTTAYEISKAIAAANKAAGKVTLKYEAYEKQIVTYAKLKVNAKLTDGMYLLPNYGRFVFNGLNKNYSLALGELTPNEQHAVICWLLDNGYTTKASFEEGAAKLVEALVPYSTWSKDYEADLKALATKIQNVNQSLLLAKSTETKLADATALYDERDAFVAKYAVTQELLTGLTNVGMDIELTGIANLLRQEVAQAVLVNAEAIKALNKVKNTMTADEVTEAIKLANELYANFYALYDEYYDVMNKVYPVRFNGDLSLLKLNSVDDLKKELVTRYFLDDLNLTTVLACAGNLESFKLLKRVIPLVQDDFADVIWAIDQVKEANFPTTTTETDFNYYGKIYRGTGKFGFSATSANLGAIADAREAVDAFFATYGDLVYEFVPSIDSKKALYKGGVAMFGADDAVTYDVKKDYNYGTMWAEGARYYEVTSTDSHKKDGDKYTDYMKNGQYLSTEYVAAKLMAAEYNAAEIAGVHKVPTAAEMSAAQAVLDSATVKVTTQALGNGKIRVQAKLDDDTWAYVKGDVDLGNKKAIAGTADFAKAPKYTVEYKFYKKKAADKAYKGYSDKAVNYTVFKNLKKGTKYNFRCAVTLKDANGNVVATRAFTGSTKGTRTAK